MPFSDKMQVYFVGFSLMCDVALRDMKLQLEGRKVREIYIPFKPSFR